MGLFLITQGRGYYAAGVYPALLAAGAVFTEDYPGVFLCGAPRLRWPEFWRGFEYFG